MTNRTCFQLHVRPDLIEEYQERHRQVWPEMLDALRAAGWHNYSLFLAPDGTLTGYVECDDFAAVQEAMASTDVNRRWQADMQRFFVGLDGDTADTGLRLVPEVFHLD